MENLFIALAAVLGLAGVTVAALAWQMLPDLFAPKGKAPFPTKLETVASRAYLRIVVADALRSPLGSYRRPAPAVRSLPTRSTEIVWKD